MKTSHVLITSLSLLGAGALGYAVYFDYKRHTDATFRKSLKKDSKKTSNASKKEAERHANAEDAIIDQLLREIRQPGVLPADIESKEQYFLQHVSLGEQLFAQGAQHYLDASIAFFKALKSYPAPVELIMIYQKAVPKVVFDCIMRIVSKDIALGGGDDQPGPSAAAGAQGIQNLDDVDDVGPSAAAARTHAAQIDKQEREQDDEEQDDDQPSSAAPATASKTEQSSVPASSTNASSGGGAPQSQQQQQQNNGTDSGTTSSQEWDTLSANSLNDMGVIVPPSQTAESAAPQHVDVEESASPVIEAQQETAPSSTSTTETGTEQETTYEKVQEDLTEPIDTLETDASAGADSEDNWEDEEKKDTN